MSDRHFIITMGVLLIGVLMMGVPAESAPRDQLKIPICIPIIGILLFFGGLISLFTGAYYAAMP